MSLLSRILPALIILIASSPTAVSQSGDPASPRPDRGGPLVVPPAGASDDEGPVDDEQAAPARERLAEDDPEADPVHPAGAAAANTTPASTGLPGIELPAYRPPRSELVREGAFLVDRRGYLHLLEMGGVVYVFDPGADGRAEPPMIALPSLRLLEMRRIAESRATSVNFIVSGQVFVFRGRNYLLVDHFRVERAVAAEQPEAEPDVEEPVAPDLFGGDEADGPSVTDLLAEIEEATENAATGLRIVDQPAGSTTSAALREGTVLNGRQGRVERGEMGGWIFVPDNDADAPSGQDTDAPLQLLPCLNLEKMMQIAQQRGSSVSFDVSGLVTVYDGRNYLLPTSFMVEVDRAGNLLPAQ
ncbi:MAG: hypothetical protein AAGI30_00355 [Planctomycetota bacterium]